MERKEYKCKGMYGYYRHKGDNRVIEYLIVDGNKFWSDEYVQQELDKAREGQFTQQELKRIEELLGFMLSDYPSSFWKPEDKSIEKKLSKLKQ